MAHPRSLRRWPVLSSALATAAGLCAAPAAARAGGLVLPGSGPVSTGRAGAAVASVDDPSALATNPAGLAGVHGTMITLGISLIDYHLTFDRAGNYDDVPARTDPWENTPYPPISDASKPEIGLGPFQIVPVLAIASDLGGKVKGLTVAAGLFAPNAYPTRSLGADYLITTDEALVAPPPTRYDTVQQKAAVILPSVAAAYRITDQLDLGARFSAGFATLEARTFVWGLDNFEEWAGKDSAFEVEATDRFVPAYGFGVRYRPLTNLELGAQWSSAIKVGARGTGLSRSGSGNQFNGMPVDIVPIADDLAACAKGGEVDALSACVDFQLPMNASIGGRWIRRDALGRQTADLELNLVWEGWGACLEESENGTCIKGASDYDITIDGVAEAVPGSGFALQPVTLRHQLDDTFAVRLGGSWQRDVGSGRLTVRGGISYDTRAAATNWERADLDGAARWTIAAGASYKLRRVSFDLGAGTVIEPSREQGTLCNPAPPPAPDDPNCAGGTTATGPNPPQPLKEPSGQAQSPFASGTYESGYLLILLGASTWF